MINMLEQKTMEYFQGIIGTDGDINLSGEFLDKCDSGVYTSDLFSKCGCWYFPLFTEQGFNTLLGTLEELSGNDKNLFMMFRVLSGSIKEQKIICNDKIIVPENYRNNNTLLFPGEPYAFKEIMDSFSIVANLNKFKDFYLK